MTDPALSTAEIGPALDFEAICLTLAGVANAIGEARVLIESGEFVDLNGLDAQVAAICSAIGDLDSDQAQRLVPILQALGTGLDALEAVLHRQFKGQLPSPGQATRRSRAAEVYGRIAQSAGGVPSPARK